MRLIFTLFILCLCACTSTPNKQSTQEETPKDNGYDVSLLNDSISPCDNFFAYTASKWIAENPIPETESRWGSFNMLIEENNKRLKSLLEEISKGDYRKRTPEHHIKNLYQAAMDSFAIEHRGIEGLRSELSMIDAMDNISSVASLTGYFQKSGMSPFFSIYVSADEKNSSMYAVGLWQDGLGLPDRDYYFREGARAENIKKSYKVFIDEMFHILTGDTIAEDSTNYSEIIFNIESELAEKQFTRVQNRQPENTYNKMEYQEVLKMFRGFDFEIFRHSIGDPSIESIVVGQPSYFQALSRIIQAHPIEHWQHYFKWTLLRSYAQHLGADYVKSSFKFYGSTLRGQKVIQPRWKRALGFLSGTTGELLGQIYVDRYFDKAYKERLNEMVENLRTAFAERIKQLEWMSPETKEKALKKISTFTKKIGYPDVWRSYNKLETTEGDHISNVKSLRLFEFERMLEDIGQATDKDRWHMSPQTVNAYYDPTQNEVVFPAGILQPPFFTPHADDAINYGAIGVVIGHEFTHGFDDQGSKYDEVGNLNDWWSAEDREKFEKRTKVLVNQFNDMVPLEGYNVNGELTLGENIADLGGLVMAYNAMEEAFKGRKPSNIDGFNYKQRFYLGYARLWTSSITDAALIQRLQTDPHSPAEARVNGPLKNLKSFQDAWGCTNDQEMILPESDKAVIW